MKFCAGFFVFMLLFSLPGFHSAVVAARGHGWDIEFAIGAPWVFGLVTGLSLYLASKRKQMNDQVAGSLLFLLGFIVSYSYEAMDKISRLIH
jgi:hypothetical protein